MCYIRHPITTRLMVCNRSCALSNGFVSHEMLYHIIYMDKEFIEHLEKSLDLVLEQGV